MRLGLFIMLLTGTAATSAHPGNGIVNLDAQRVLTGDAVRNGLWQFELGRVPVKLTTDRFHCHWVTKGLDGNLYAETLSNIGAVWKTTVFRLDSNGKAPRPVASWSESVSGVFAVGRSGEIIRQVPSGLVAFRSGEPERPFRGNGRTKAGEPALGEITAFAWGPEDDLYVASGTEVHRVGKDGVAHFVARVTGKVIAPLYAGRPSQLPKIWGLAVDERKNLFVAVPALGKVVRIAPDGSRRTLVSSQNGWATLGVATGQGLVWLLESRTEGNSNLGPRVRMIRTNGTIVQLGAVS